MLVKQRLDKRLVTAYPQHSRSFLVKQIRQGAVYVNQCACYSPGTMIHFQDQLWLRDPPAHHETTMQPEAMPLNIVFEDEHLIVLDKRAGHVVHPAPGNRQHTLVNGLLHHYGQEGIQPPAERLGIVHRLDKQTSGLLVVAKTMQTYTGLKKQFSHRTLSRRYTALVWGVPSPVVGRVDRPMQRHPRDRRRMRVLRSGGKPALTLYKTEEVFGSMVSRLTCCLKTGRTHQIRVHLSHIGHSVLGDALYSQPHQSCDGRDFQKKIQRHCLHACSLCFVHPVSEKNLSFTAPLPSDMELLLQDLRKKYT